MDLLFRPERTGFRLLRLVAAALTALATAWLFAALFLWGGVTIYRILDGSFFVPVFALLLLGQWLALVFSGLLLLAFAQALRLLALYGAARFDRASGATASSGSGSGTG